LKGDRLVYVASWQNFQINWLRNTTIRLNQTFLSIIALGSPGIPWKHWFILADTCIWPCSKGKISLVGLIRPSHGHLPGHLTKVKESHHHSSSFNSTDWVPEPALLPSSENVDFHLVHFKHDRIYCHNIMWVNYTTYDVRHEEDILHTSTCQHNIMVLAHRTGNSTESSSLTHPFAYGWVLGIYHVNVVYVGPGATDYQPIRLEFLWVQWYNRITDYCGWKAHKLDQLKFCTIQDADAFTFVDPSDVLRGCHIIPRFREGWAHSNGRGSLYAPKMLKTGRNITLTGQSIPTSSWSQREVYSYDNT